MAVSSMKCTVRKQGGLLLSASLYESITTCKYVTEEEQYPISALRRQSVGLG